MNVLASDAMESLREAQWSGGLLNPVAERGADPPNVGKLLAAGFAPGEVVAHLLPPFCWQGLVSERREVLSEAFTAGIGSLFHL